MNDVTFRVIIPTYGDCKYLKSAIDSVLQQTYLHLYLIVVHDNYFDESKLGNATRYNTHFDYTTGHEYSDLYLSNHRWNGGARNAAMAVNKAKEGIEYVIFLDHDDTIPNREVLEHLAKFIEDHKFPDMVRLPYSKRYMSDGHTVRKMLRNETTLDICTETVRVAPWTKCIKTSLMPTFPENTVFEDVIHHLKACDICNTYALFNEPVVEWRMWDGQTSKRKDDKWQSSEYRFIADLMDLKLNKPITKKRLETRLRDAKRALRDKLNLESI